MKGKLMRNSLLIVIFCCAAVFSVAAKDETPAADKILELTEQGKKIEAEMYKLRIELIKQDPALLKLHKQIMALHKELSLKVDSKKEMRILLSRVADISKQLEELKVSAAAEKKASKTKEQ
jgi:predicted RNase H-like nuclease (RuvC/YqgF family)